MSSKAATREALKVLKSRCKQKEKKATQGQFPPGSMSKSLSAIASEETDADGSNGEQA